MSQTGAAHHALALPALMKVLIVEDEDVDRLVLARHLKEAFGDTAEIGFADGHAAAVSAFGEKSYHFVLADEGLGETSGVDLIRWVQNNEPDTVAILITGNNNQVVELAALDAGAWQFIPKSELSTSMLARCLRYAWRQSRQEVMLEESRRQLAAKEAFVSATLDAVDASILTITRTGDIQLANKNAMQLLGLQTLPCPWPDNRQLLDLRQFKPLPAEHYPIQQLLAGRELAAHSVLMARAGQSSPRHIRVEGRIVPGIDEKTLGVLLLQDITVEEQNRERAERASRMESLGQMTGGIAHDFNNLLATILASAEVAQLLPDQLDTCLAAIVKATARGTELTNRLLAFSRIEESHRETVEITHFLNQTKVMIERTLIAKCPVPVSVSVAVNGGPIYLDCNAGELEHVILNLAINARDAIIEAGKPGEILLGVRHIETNQLRLGRNKQAEPSNHGYVEISVSDNGTGMSAHVKSKATEPFFTTKPLNTGTGLGLTSTTNFVDKQGGQLRIYSDQSIGTTIRMVFPAHQAIEPAGPREETRLAALAKGQGETVLVAEDEDDLRDMTCAILTSLGYSPLPASNGERAIALLQSDPSIAAVLSDIVMTGSIGGRELIQILKDKDDQRPVALMSGYVGTNIAELNVPFLPKPCAAKDLSRIMRELLANVSDRQADHAG